MKLRLLLPPQLAVFANGNAVVCLEGADFDEVLKNMDKSAPMLKSQIFDGNGRSRQFVGLFLNDVQIHGLVDFPNRLLVSNELVIVAAIAGG